MANFCPRLVDYFVIVGSHSTNRTSMSIQAPTILNRFPPCDHSDFSLPPDVAFFCQPEGCFNAAGPRSARSVRGVSTFEHSPTSFVFTLTDTKSGKIRYGISLNFFRPIHRNTEIRRNSRTISKSRNALTTGTAVNESHMCSYDSQTCPGNSLEDASDSDHNPPTRSCLRLHTHTLTSLCIVTHHPFISNFRWLLEFLHLLIHKLHVRSRTKLPVRESVWSALTGAIQNVTSPPLARCIHDLEVWILRLLSAPAPVPGRTCLHLFIQPQHLTKPLIFAMPDKSRLPLADFPLHLPIHLLGIARTLRILVCLLLEQKVVLQSADYNKLSLCVLAFVALLYPLQYMFPVIPLLPPCMPGSEQILIAPTPYIIGVPTSFYAARKVFRMPKDVWLANLDTQELSYPEILEEIPDLPEVECKNLVRQLNCILEYLPSPEKGPSLDSAVSQLNRLLQASSATQIVGYNPLTYITSEASASVTLRVSMVLFITSKNILSGLQQHTRTLRLYPRPVVAFLFDRFMKSRPRPCLFTSMLAKTQTVEYFAELNLCAQNEAYQRITAGEYAPELIGDKPEWFANLLPPVRFDVWLESFTNGTLPESILSDVLIDSNLLLHALIAARLHMETLKLGSHRDCLDPHGNETVSNEVKHVVFQDVVSDFPTDESASDTETEYSTTSVASTLSDLASDPLDSGIGESQHRRNHDLGRSSNELGSSVMVRWKTDGLKTAVPEAVLICPGQPLPPSLAVHFKPTLTPVDAPANEYSGAKKGLEARNERSSPLGCAGFDESKNLQLTSGHTTDSPTSLVESLVLPPNSAIQPADTTVLNSSTLTGSEAERNGHNVPSDEPSNWGSPLFVLLGELFNPTAFRTEESRKTNVEKDSRRRLEDERYITQLARSIRSGNIPGIFSRGRITSLLECENYRNLLLSRLNNCSSKTLPRGLSDHVEDVIVENWNQYKALVWILRKLTVGLETNLHSEIFIPTLTNVHSDAYKARASSTVGHVTTPDGFASAFGLLEIAHTHYYPLPSRPLHRGSSTSLVNTLVTPSPPSSASSLPPEMADSGGAVPTVSTHGGGIQTNSPPSPLVPHSSRSSLQGRFSALNENANIGRRRSITIIRRDQLSPNFASSTREGSLSPAFLGGNRASSAATSLNGHSLQTQLLEQVPRSTGTITLMPKSSRTFGYRYHHCKLVPVLHSDTPDAFLSSVPNTHLNVTGTDWWSQLDHTEVQQQSRWRTGRTYVFEDLVSAKDVRSKLWDDMQFWEDAYLDAVAQERDILGMDFRPTELLLRYGSFDPSKRKDIELEEDRLLATLMHNMIAFMIMVNVDRAAITKKVQRLLAKSHMELRHSQEIRNLLDSLAFLHGNDIDLEPLHSKTIHFRSYEVHRGIDATGELIFIEVRTDYLLLRSLSGSILDRWWYDQLINISYRLHTHILCISIRVNQQSNLQFFYTEKCQILYQEIQHAMEQVTITTHRSPPGRYLGDEVRVTNAETDCVGTIKICAEGFSLNFEIEQLLIGIPYVKRCSAPEHDLFVIEFFDRAKKCLCSRKLRTDLASELLYYFQILISMMLPSKIQKGPIESTTTSICTGRASTTNINVPLCTAHRTSH